MDQTLDLATIDADTIGTDKNLVILWQLKPQLIDLDYIGW